MIRNERHIKSFGNRVRELRRMKGMTQNDLADLLNTDRSYIAKIESGKIEIKLGTIFNLYQAFEITHLELFSFPIK
jgi:putative transcriptional regulator